MSTTETSDEIHKYRRRLLRIQGNASKSIAFEMSANLRIRLKFDEKDVNGNKAQLYLVDRKNVTVISDLLAAIRDKFYGDLSVEINLLIDEFVLPVDERVDIIRDNDVISVKCISSIKQKTIKCDKNQRPKPPNDTQSNMSFATPPKKRFEYMTGSEVCQPLTSSTPHVLLKKIPNLLKSRTYTLPSCDVNKIDEEFVLNVIENKNSESKKGMQTPKAVKTNVLSKNKPTAFDKSFFADVIPKELMEDNEIKTDVTNDINFEEQMKYENCEPLTLLPKIGDIVAFKIMRISASSYLPEVSEFKAGKVVLVDSSTQMLCLDMLKDDVIKEFCRPNVVAKTKKLYADWNTLVDPKLIVPFNDNSMSTEVHNVCSVEIATPSIDSSETFAKSNENDKQITNIVLSNEQFESNEINEKEAQNTVLIDLDAEDLDKSHEMVQIVEQMDLIEIKPVDCA